MTGRDERAIAAVTRTVGQYVAEFRRAGEVNLYAVAFGSAGGLANAGGGYGMTDAEIVAEIVKMRKAVRRIEQDRSEDLVRQYGLGREPS